jgi:hypothetical protein
MKTFAALSVLCLIGSCTAAPRTVTYKVDGNPDWPKTSDGFGPAVQVTIQNQDGGTEMHEGPTPYREQITVPAGAFVYVSAQAKEGNEVSCEIDEDGKAIRQSHSDGQFSIATCSATA